MTTEAATKRTMTTTTITAAAATDVATNISHFVTYLLISLLTTQYHLNRHVQLD